MKEQLLILIIFFLPLLAFGQTAKKLQKTRVKNGNELTFVYFKKEDAKKDPYYKMLAFMHPKEIDSMTAYYWGGQTEVTNKQYGKFLASLKSTDSLKYELHKPKTVDWRPYFSDTSYADSMSQNYGNSDLFGNYPVVNITPEDAGAFVTWLNQIEPDSLVFYRLFKSYEWTQLFNVKPETDNSFAWETDYWRNNSGRPLANFAEFDQDQIRYNQLSDNVSWEGSDSLGYQSFVKGPVNVWSYNPNGWGAYNMSGNVAELVESYYKIDSTWYCATHGGSWRSPVFYLRKSPTETYKLPSPCVGFRVLKIHLKSRIE